MSALALAADFLFPPTCIGCGERCETSGFCRRCRVAIERPNPAACSHCGRAFRSGPSHLCASCLDHSPSYAKVWAGAVYTPSDSATPLNRAIHRFKYGRDVSHARPLAGLMTAALRDALGYDAVVPVPLHVARLRWRGFNQAVLLARPLARLWRARLEPLALRRCRSTVPQVGLGEAERRRNIAGAFEVRDGHAIRGRRILLIDDVYTTGATVEECSRVLLEGGAVGVDVAVVARAL
jgi:ComF family protein